MKQLILLIVTLVTTILIQFTYSADLNLRNIFSKAIKTPQDESILAQIEQRLPKFLDLDIPSNENADKVFSKFKDAIRLFPGNIQRETSLDANSARDLFPALQPIYRYVKESSWKSILKLIDLSKEIIRIPARNLSEKDLNNLLSNSEVETVAKVLELNSNRLDFSDEQKTILVQNYIDKIQDKVNPNNFQELITQKLGASFLRYLPLNFLTKNPIFNDNTVLRNVATWLHLLTSYQRDAITNKVYRTLNDATSKIVQPNVPLRMAAEDPSTYDMIIRMMPSLSTKQIINVIGNKIVPLLGRSSIRDDQTCTTVLALVNRTLEEKRRSNRYFNVDPQLVQRWQECYSGCDLRILVDKREDVKELLKHHPSPENCEALIGQVKLDYGLERSLTASKLRDASDVFGTLYQADEINNLSNELMTELGRDEKVLEKLGSQDLTANQARTIINKIPRSTQNLWGKNMLGKLGNLIPGIDNNVLRQILMNGRGDLPSLFNNSAPSFVRKLVPSKVLVLIDQYATEPNLAKYRQLLASDYAKKYIKSETLMKILQLAPDVLRLIRFTPAQASGAIANRLGVNKTFDGSLGSLGLISNFINGLTKNDINKIKPEESLHAIQQIFGSSRNKNIDNQMQSNIRYAFGNVLRRGLQTSEATQNVDEYIKGLFREDNLVDDLNPQLFTTMTNAELDAINRLSSNEANRFWNAVSSIQEPVCCSIINENRFRLADYALKYYGSATGDIDNTKLSQLGPFLATSLRASDIRRITTDALINKISFFKSNCFQPAKTEAQALGARLHDALIEVDDTVKGLYLDLFGELVAYLPIDINASKRTLLQRANYLSKSLDKLRNREEKCQIPDSDGYLSQAANGIKRTLVNAFLDQYSSVNDFRERRQTDRKGNNTITCQDLKQLGTSISGLSAEQISSIDDNTVFKCIDLFASVNDYNPDRIKQISQKYLRALESQGRRINSLSQSELYGLNSLLTGFTSGELFLLRNEHFHDANFLSFLGNLDGWTNEQLKMLSSLVLPRESLLTPTILENAGKILCTFDDQILRNISIQDIKSYLSIFSYVECPNEGNVNYSSTMFDIVKNIYKGDTFRPNIFGSLGTIAAGIKLNDLASLSPDLINFFPQQALSRLPSTILKSFSNEQLGSLNIEQIKSIPTNLLSSLNGKQMSILNQILYPFRTSGANTKYSFSIISITILPFISFMYIY